MEGKEVECENRIEEGESEQSEELKIVGTSQDLSSDDIDELDFSMIDKTPIALSADDYETL